MIRLQVLNPTRPNPGRREKMKLNFYVHTYFLVPRKVLGRP